MKSYINIIKDEKLPRRRNLIVNELDVTKALAIVHQHGVHPTNVEVACCGWDNDPVKWFINFDVVDLKWRKIIETLKIRGIKAKTKKEGYFEI